MGSSRSPVCSSSFSSSEDTAMKEYIVKIHADDINKLDDLLCNAVEEFRMSSISAFSILVEDGKSLAHLHTDKHMDVERTQANDIANLLRLNAIAGSQ
jgi:hypothetical protein